MGDKTPKGEKPRSIIDTRGNTSAADAAKKDPRRMAAMRAAGRAEKAALKYYWRFWARANQVLCLTLIWTVWVIQAGRGWGKTRTGAEAVIEAVEKHGCRRIALVGPTHSDVMDVMIEGESGILACSKPGNMPVYNVGKCRLTWPNGAIALGFTAEKPDRIRGKQFDFAWCDEIAVWRYVERAWNNLMAALRLTTGPCRVVVTSTPNKTCKFMRELAAAAGTLLTKGPTKENLKNLHGNIKKDIKRLEGTSLGLQEYGGEDVGDADGARFTQALIDRDRIIDPNLVPKRSWFIKIAAGIDPNTTKSKTADDVGICLAGLGPDGDTYILGEYGDEGDKMGPEEWPSELVRASEYHGAREVYAETNAGGDMIALALKNCFGRTARPGKPMPRIPKITPLRSKENKITRAEPVVALMHAGRIRFCGHMPRLEAQLTTYVPGEDGTKVKSPGAYDAFVFVVNGLNPNCGSSSNARSVGKDQGFNKTSPRG